jgi:hypothetical protein
MVSKGVSSDAGVVVVVVVVEVVAAGAVEVEVEVGSGCGSVVVAGAVVVGGRRGVIGLLVTDAGTGAGAGAVVVVEPVARAAVGTVADTGVRVGAFCDGATTLPPTTNLHPLSCMAESIAMVAYILWSWIARSLSGWVSLGAGGGP